MKKLRELRNKHGEWVSHYITEYGLGLASTFARHLIDKGYLASDDIRALAMVILVSVADLYVIDKEWGLKELEQYRMYIEPNLTEKDIEDLYNSIEKGIINLVRIR